MSRNIQLRVAFDGTMFHGWQSQTGLRTVQAVLEEAIRRVVRHPITLIGSGRTDSGVHARAHISNFATTCVLSSVKMRHAIGSRLDDDLAVLSAREVDAAFNATRDATCKLYRYRIYNLETRPVERCLQRYVLHCWHKLDVDRMRAGAEHFIGRQDFRAMASHPDKHPSTVRTVLRCDVERVGAEIRIDVVGTGFLHHQVRNMVGTLMAVGRGRFEPDRVATILASRDRNEAGPRAAARGLCLQWVRYPGHLLRAPQRDDSGGDDSGGDDSGGVDLSCDDEAGDGDPFAATPSSLAPSA